MMNLFVEKMKASHIENVALLEKECFSTPWSEVGLRAELNNPNARFYVAFSGGRVVGYIGAHNILGEVYITNVAVSKDFRRQGIGNALITHLLNVCANEDAEFVTLEVRESNSQAIALYEKTGFSNVGSRRNFYENPREDAILMTYYF